MEFTLDKLEDAIFHYMHDKPNQLVHLNDVYLGVKSLCPDLGNNNHVKFCNYLNIAVGSFKDLKLYKCKDTKNDIDVIKTFLVFLQDSKNNEQVLDCTKESTNFVTGNDCGESTDLIKVDDKHIKVSQELDTIQLKLDEMRSSLQNVNNAYNELKTLNNNNGSNLNLLLFSVTLSYILGFLTKFFL